MLLVASLRKVNMCKYPPIGSVKQAWSEVWQSVLDLYLSMWIHAVLAWGVTISIRCRLLRCYISSLYTCTLWCNVWHNRQVSEYENKGMYAPGFLSTNASLLVVGRPLAPWTRTATTHNTPPQSDIHHLFKASSPSQAFGKNTCAWWLPALWSEYQLPYHWFLWAWGQCCHLWCIP